MNNSIMLPCGHSVFYFYAFNGRWEAHLPQTKSSHAYSFSRHLKINITNGYETYVYCNVCKNSISTRGHTLKEVMEYNED